ncbi:putative allatostatin B receptor [Daphnia sinensis]|uniref:Allatostatin B receptor n=1 Tax=Daphnia sinensis TaxID=1820382 RepID=A0AAD5KI65_9CRUS|nr:putative allatostatin B receptor [Daphnia sinensis]
MAAVTNETTSTDLNQQLELENEKNLSTDYIAYDQRPETYIVPVLFSAIFLIGVVGNGCLIYIFCRHKSMRSLPNLYIFNLAVGDLLVLLCSVPFTATIYTFDSWPYGEFVCKASEFAKDMSVGVSIFTLTALSFERCPSLCVALIWLASIGLALPAVLFSHLLVLHGEEIPELELVRGINGTLVGPAYREIFICYPFPSEFGPAYPKMVVVSRFLLHYCLPLLFIGTFYTIMARHLLQRYVDRVSLLKISSCFIVLFAICFLPIHIFSLWFHFDANSRKNFKNSWNVFRIFGFVLACTNSCINPVALYSASSNFRNHFNRLLYCCGDAEDSGSRETSGLRPEYRRDNDHALVEIPGQSTRPFEHAVSRQRMVCQSVDEMC